MAFSSMFKAAAFLAVVVPAQAFAPASLGAKTVRFRKLVFTRFVCRNSVNWKGFGVFLRRKIRRYSIHEMSRMLNFSCVCLCLFRSNSVVWIVHVVPSPGC